MILIGGMKEDGNRRQEQSKRLSSLILFSFFLTFLVFPLGIYLAASFIIYKAKLIDTMKECKQKWKYW